MELEQVYQRQKHEHTPEHLHMQRIQEMVTQHNIKLVDIRFTDLLGTWQHFTVPINEFNESNIQEGFGFDGSSIRCFQSIHESDMLLIPDLKTCFVDPFLSNTMSVICDIKDPITKQMYSRDPRYIAKKAETYLKNTMIADTAYFGPEAEFFVFDHIRYGQNEFSGFYEIDSDEGIWNSNREEETGNKGYKIRHKQGYFPVPPTDSQQELRSKMVLIMEKLGILVERQHHEVATAGQAEIDVRFNSLLSMADTMMMYKYVVKNVAQLNGKTATFMPKPLFNDNGSGMHCHQSLWKGGVNLFAGDKACGLSELGLYYLGGILKHAPALVALTNPTTNSYKRLVPGFEAPVNLVFSSRNRSAAIRIPMYSESPKAKRLEFRTPDPLCNPYVGFAAMVMAGLDGIKNKIHPGEEIKEDLFSMDKEKLAHIPHVPGSLAEALNNLENDHAFLLEGGVFTKDVIDAWISYKREHEVTPVNMRPHPWEFMLYFDA